MANVTNAITKIISEYNNSDMLVNSALKYRFTYNGYATDIFYTVKDGLQKQLLLAIMVNDVTYITTLNFYKLENDYYMNFYLSNELYKKIQFSLLYVNNHCAVNPYFETMIDYIMTHQPIAVQHRRELRGRRDYIYKYERNNPYFKTTKRTSMSPKMRAKILKKYNKELAQKILKFCGTTRTLVFTPNIEDSKDIEVYMNTHSSM